MNAFVAPVFAQAGHFQWGNLAWCCLAIAVFLAVFAIFGKWVGSTHPVEIKKPLVEIPAPVVLDDAVLTPQLLAAISAAVHATLGSAAQVQSVALAKSAPVSVEGLMLTWSLEGRRQIYTSHRVR